MTVLITLTVAGVDSGPFNLYSDIDGYVSPFETGISTVSLLAGFSSSSVPNSTTIIRVMSDGVCTNFIDIPVSPIPPTTTTTSSSSTSTTTSTSTSTSSTTTSTTTVLCNDYFNNTGNSLNGIDYTDCDGTPFTNQSVNPGQSICVQGSPSGGDSGFLILLGNC